MNLNLQKIIYKDLTEENIKWQLSTDMLLLKSPMPAI